jgi:hypothetical protein
MYAGREYAVPANVDLYLKESFGDWRKLDTVEYLADAKNMELLSPKRVAARYFLRLTDHFLNGNVAQLRRARDKLFEINPPDQLLLMTLNNMVKNPTSFVGAQPVARPNPPARRAAHVPAKNAAVQPGKQWHPAPSKPEAPKNARPVDSRYPVAVDNPQFGLAPLSPTERQTAPNPLARFVRRTLNLSEEDGTLQARHLKGLLDAAPDNTRLRTEFEDVATRAGRENMKAGNYEEACRILYSLRAVTKDREAADHDLSMASLKGARQAEATGDKEKALRFWRYLYEVQPGSRAALQGIVRCS